MTRDDLIRMARDAGFVKTKIHPALERFAELIAADEREACAKACDAMRREWARLKVGAKDGRYEMMEEAASVCEDAIRERSNDEAQRCAR